jgi:hypothetical protein
VQQGFQPTDTSNEISTKEDALSFIEPKEGLLKVKATKQRR